MPKTQAKTTWKSVQVPEYLYREMSALVESGRFVSKNEIARNAIRWYLDALKKGELP